MSRGRGDLPMPTGGGSQASRPWTDAQRRTQDARDDKRLLRARVLPQGTSLRHRACMPCRRRCRRAGGMLRRH
eukprot:8593657-Alexandrium_andersonii.AAC.1